MKTTLSSQYHDYTSWLNKLSLYGDEIAIMQRQLEMVHENQVAEGTKKVVDYFRNKILTQKINAETMWHHLKFEVMEWNNAIKKNISLQRNDQEHQYEFELVEKFETGFHHLRKEFQAFVSKWRHEERNLAPPFSSFYEADMNQLNS